MKLSKFKFRPIHHMSFGKRDVRTQFGALCWRKRKKEVEILLVTSLGTGRWIIPKGWPQRGQTPARAAAVEAWEEGGVTGDVLPVCIGIYGYEKQRRRGMHPCVVAVFPLKVGKEHNKWPERDVRKRKWVSLDKAAAMVDEPELKRLINDFNPSQLEATERA